MTKREREALLLLLLALWLSRGEDVTSELVDWGFTPEEERPFFRSE